MSDKIHVQTNFFSQKYRWGLLIIFVFIFADQVFSQEITPKNNALNLQIIQEVFSAYETPTAKKRTLLNLKDKKLSLKLNPLTYVATGLLFVYQNVLSEQISANCNYEMSCSEYTKKCIERYGLIRGSFIGLHQLSTCVPMIQYDHCDHTISKNGKIINPIEQ